LPAGLKNITWSGTFLSDTAGVSLTWGWGAAVYNCFNSNPNQLGLKSVDDTKNDCRYKNSDKAGTPENYKSCLVGGATGSGGGNYTGDLSATKTISF
jgi:hypothetical protein